MRRLITVSLLSLFMILAVTAQNEQKFVYRDNLDDTTRLNLNFNYAGSHFLGEAMAKKMYRIQETYTYVEKGTPMSPSDKTIVQKPSIFYAIKKINKYYRKQVKKGKVDSSTAFDDLSRILDIGFAIYSQDTEEFEDYLREHRKPEELLDAFAMVELE